MIIVIRGTNGSGKSHAVREILKHRTTTVTFADEESVVIRLPGVARPILVVGPYTDGRSMGGCDCIRRPSKIYDLIQFAIDCRYHVLLEGVVLATKPYLKLFKDGHDVRYAFFDPPIATCRANIRARQKRKGHVSRLSTNAMMSKLNRAREMYADADWMDMPVKRFPNPARDAVPWIIKQLRSA